MNESNSHIESEPAQSKAAAATVHFSISQLIAAFLGTVGLALSAVIGAGWYLYTEGVFNPDEEARRSASEARYAFEKAQADLVDARGKIDSLSAQLSNSAATIARHEAGLELKKTELDFRANRNVLITQIIVACVGATNAGEQSEKVTATEKPGDYYQTGGAGTAAAAAAITAVARPQSGARVTGECAKTFSDKIAPLFK